MSPSFYTNPIPSSTNDNPTSNPIRKSTRISHPPTYLQDYHCTLKNNTINCISQSPSSSSQCKFHISSSISYNSLSSAHKHFALNISTLSEPSTYEEAMCNEQWKRAVDTELTALLKNHTWDLVKLPTHKKAISCKWVFKLKFNVDGTVERHKARLVAKGFTQTEGIDYIDTFSPVVKMTIVRTFMAIAAAQNWPLYQLDVNTAFLHGDLHVEVYMKPPPGLHLSSPDLVCKLQRSLYGLNQASRQWNAKLTETLISTGYKQSKADYSLFTKQSSTGFTAILVYVDDLVLGGTDTNEIVQLKSLLDTKFSIKDLGTLKYFLGFEVARSKLGISLCQRKYTLDLLQDTCLLATKPCPTPMQPQLQLHKSSGSPISDPTTYRRLIGRLLYLTHSRPEIAYAASKLSQFLDSPNDAHMLAGLHILRYLKNNPGQGFFFSSSSSLNLKGYSDSDWGACPDTRRSTTRFCFFLGTLLISWKSKKQSVVFRSSSEAEYRTLAHATCEGQWLLYLLHDFRIPHDFPIILYCDNKSAMYIAAKPVFHERTKHIEIDCHVVRDKLQAKTIHLLPVTSKEQIADIFTKSLHPGPFHTLQSKLGTLDIYSSLRGTVDNEDLQANSR
ncbi:retrovirus-related Pol polyprotein from transposon TNT 1-94 [Trifolium medium]|uniref:Retrovirus-related Pol polyprotein from transposon TNT 1-94 n=1 Tax=Trifolium medium TaxID=97028 RepID=A0A392LWU7_9FABA|nr:retrovirus-related Pol polyprotein from transposon TNT 1-94 [Trifolium medium]